MAMGAGIYVRENTVSYLEINISPSYEFCLGYRGEYEHDEGKNVLK